MVVEKQQVALTDANVEMVSELVEKMDELEQVPSVPKTTKKDFVNRARREAVQLDNKVSGVMLQEEMLKKRDNKAYMAMLTKRAKLPAAKKREELLRCLASAQVTVICGETGCGKSTQCPQFILDDAIENGWGDKCQIICTQPRRISAIGVADRVAEERSRPKQERPLMIIYNKYTQLLRVCEWYMIIISSPKRIYSRL